MLFIMIILNSTRTILNVKFKSIINFNIMIKRRNSVWQQRTFPYTRAVQRDISPDAHRF